ncbi:hypothetical protein QQF64_015559 [Cirrhinus molitorella]|uniref:Immunoglobulin V-set domain-containing protein n=1 Tax=Cirrhinus molitorella TaxID=172907 RepID=A0ABR3NVM3_9TELE
MSSRLTTVQMDKSGFSAESPVFVETGASVKLDIQTQEQLQFDILAWMDNKSDSIVRYNSDAKTEKLHDSYKDRVDFNPKTYSLTLENMQKTDSGLYTARITGLKNKDIVIYRVSVIDAVEAPVLTVNSNQSTSGSCTVNFTCRAHELMINSSYQNNRCSPEKVSSDEINTLTLVCNEKFIICNHSNPVSWKQDKKTITQLCNNDDDNKKVEISTNAQSNSHLLGIIVGSVVACVLIICTSIVLYCKYKKGAQEEVVEGSTVYAHVEAQEMQKLNSDCHTYDIPDRVQAQPQNETGDTQPETTYCTVGQHQKQTNQQNLPETIYSTRVDNKVILAA